MRKYELKLRYGVTVTPQLVQQDDQGWYKLDVANFEAYCRYLKTQAYRLDSDYLIFAYDLTNYEFKIKKLWLKKVWEITGSSLFCHYYCYLYRKI